MMMRAPENSTRDKLHELLHADRKSTKPRLRIDVETEIFKLLGGRPRHATPSDDARSR